MARGFQEDVEEEQVSASLCQGSWATPISTVLECLDSDGRPPFTGKGGRPSVEERVVRHGRGGQP